MIAYHREPESTPDLLERIQKAEDNGSITTALASALYVAVYHQCQIDYDAMADIYAAEGDEIKQLLVDSGVVIELTEEQTRAVKYGV